MAAAYRHSLENLTYKLHRGSRLRGNDGLAPTHHFNPVEVLRYSVTLPCHDAVPGRALKKEFSPQPHRFPQPPADT